MKITNVRVLNIGVPQKNSIYNLKMLEGMRRDQYTHEVHSTSDGILQLMKVETDEGIEGLCTLEGARLGSMNPYTLEQMRHLVIGLDPFNREEIYQKMHRGNRWLYQAPGWQGPLDNCLWDIIGKASELPVWAIMGRVRESLPAYKNIRGETIQLSVEDAIRSVEAGFPAIKDHFYHPPNENIKWFEAIRSAVGPDIDIMHDAVGIYSLEQAIRIGRVLTELDYRWFEEPLPERHHKNMKSLCDAVDIPILAPEMMMDDVDLSAQWLISGATDLIRANARHGTTGIIKLAHLAELHGTTIELNAGGALSGLVHAHLAVSISNTSYYEYFDGSQEKSGLDYGITNPPSAENGNISPPDLPGWGAIWDWDKLKSKTLSEV